MYLEILKAYVRKILKHAILRKLRKKIFLYFGNNLRKYFIGNFETVLSKCPENYKTIMKIFTVNF